MMIIMRTGASKEEVKNVVARVKSFDLDAHLSDGSERTVIGVVGDGRPVDKNLFIRLPGVDNILPISKPYKLASREFYPADSLVPVGEHKVGNGSKVIIAGPCAVESREQLMETAKAVKAAGAHALRGGAFKPRTSPYSFQGLGEKGLKLLAEARDLTGLPIVTEIISPELVPLVASYADVLQIGARNMQNYSLLKAAGLTKRTILLKRGMSATISDFLMAAEYILSKGNQNVILCERGIRTFETATRNTTDINAIPVLKSLTHLPVVLDPSHSTGDWRFVCSLARSGIAAGADGLIVEVHPDPANALSDGAQSLKPKRFATLIEDVNAIADVLKERNITPIPMQ
ncbi:MAG: 3-deoxy-7-phosphoheptulonate synthase [Anaerolineae bacterium]|jgi:3-deoxy-7-phosphoheptulonate synthase|nr:3-deoxy-7-phosphoheptulonate synthase [Anaerolineae bacterium]MBT4309267.1 3-deoxy-7-phosphoheptulonate synthase [Anaerolineae bacterium]MBT4458502.1 3-deoxy-7-phosphoheptulonate synthase [Anaerolineae bacterium]MBT6062751.1 3-deoxy-7-phosphoheptulonate synthase [Anaerolineae bacterium]MBT6322391.1 3-deoxy-7-phosphoheptulonate synthase [Anaerolineae bacterium]